MRKAVSPEDSAPVHVEHRENNRGIYVAFVVAVLAVLLIPLVCMPFAHESTTTEKRELAPVPQPMVDGKPNLSLLSDAGDYFSDHFAFRNVMVDANATIRQKLFLTSATQNVVVGTDGWLYYAGTLNDYQRRNRMSDQALRNACTNLALMQEYFESQGKAFLLAMAPNKNGLYPEHMPYYEVQGEGESNFDRLVPLLREAGIHYVDLHAAFRSKDEVLYFKRDSHWNDRGAMLAYDEIMSALGREAVDSSALEQGNTKHIGDVDSMLHPAFPEPEEQRIVNLNDAYRFAGESTDVEDSYLITSSDSAVDGTSLIMYRDSFGNNLIAPFAASYAQAVFTKLVPYDMSARMCAFAHDVVVERTERHLAYFSTNPPYILAPERSVRESDAAASGTASMRVAENGPYMVVEGSLEGLDLDKVAHVYVRVSKEDGSEKTYEAFRVSATKDEESDSEGDAQNDSDVIAGDGGYRCYLDKEEVGAKVLESAEVMVQTQNGVQCINVLHHSAGQSK
ncbi:MAG: hypothetical protein IKF78_07985 [Atopobiaceae bacterium]|nr:hypothetical protein [Atopobiaceae bacterium]